MQLFLDAREPLHFFFFDRVDRNAGPPGNDVFDVRLRHDTHARGFADVEFLANVAEVLAFELLLILVVLGLFEILARDRAFHPRHDELDPPLNVGHLRRQRGLAQLYAGAGFIEKIDRLVRQEPIGNIPVGKIHGRFDRLVRVIHHVEFLVTRL